MFLLHCLIHANLEKPGTIHNVDTTRYVATFGCPTMTSNKSPGPVDIDTTHIGK